jgi:hypothetical protein
MAMLCLSTAVPISRQTRSFACAPTSACGARHGPTQGRGRRPIHGAKFKLKNPATWGQPVQVLEVEDAQLGRGRISLWRDLHFRQSAQHRMIVVRIERLDARGTRRDPKELWLAWVGEEPPPLEEWWRLYLRRFGEEHWYRFAKQRLYWTLPRFSTPERAERWSDLIPMITWQLWLARQITADKPRPWQKPQSNLTPGRVCQGIGGVLAAISTPAPGAQTPRKIAGLAQRAPTQLPAAVSGDEKELEAAQIGFLTACIQLKRCSLLHSAMPRRPTLV